MLKRYYIRDPLDKKERDQRIGKLFVILRMFGQECFGFSRSRATSRETFISVSTRLSRNLWPPNKLNRGAKRGCIVRLIFDVLPGRDTTKTDPMRCAIL